MKLKASKKEIRQQCFYLFSVGYCNMQYLLYYKSPFAYSTRVEGWACDYYDVNGVVISTGYSPIGDKVDYKKVRDYETQAEKIICGNADNKRELIDDLLKAFINEIKL